ncbi:MAG: SDR family NAD(P)-dependent oxidoreductase, partial [Solirubrobacteraceae bacterium]|nr:SDR family NAD(P)-dependent oxidoreductase [Solirubrobacteraceae bacterium]
MARPVLPTPVGPNSAITWRGWAVTEQLSRRPCQTPHMEIRGATALVTGASGGIGAAIAEGLHRRGATLRLTGRNEAQLEAVAARTGGQVITCDLGDRAQLDGLAAASLDCDIFVANAGLPGSGPLLDFSPEE